MKGESVSSDDFYMVDVHTLISNGVHQPHRSMSHGVDSYDEPTVLARKSPSNQRPVGLSWNQETSVLYGVSQKFEGETESLLTVDPLTGITTVVSEFVGLGINQNIQGMSIDQDNRCFVVATDVFNHDTLSFLYECDLATAELTFIGSQSMAPDIHDLAATCDGVLYGTDSTSLSLYTLDKNNGAVTLVGPLSRDIIKAAISMTFDRSTNTLYQYVLNEGLFQTALARLDKSTGQAEFISDFFIYGRNIGAIKSSCLAEAEPFALNIGFSGSWFNPETAGQGFLLDVLQQSNTLFVAWFTYATNSVEKRGTTIGSAEHRWLSAQGELGDDNTVELTVFNTSGGIFNDPQAVESNPVGTMTVNFDDCLQGTISYVMDNGESGTIPIQRIANDNVSLCESLLNSEK